MGVSDPRAVAAREANRDALQAEANASRLRRIRDENVRALRRDDPKRWTYDVLARAIGTSPETIAVIIKGDPRKHRKDTHGSRRLAD